MTMSSLFIDYTRPGFDDAEPIPAPSKPTMRDHVRRLVNDGPVSADMVVSVSGCTRNSALTLLSVMRKEGLLTRVAEGWYAKPDHVRRTRAGGPQQVALDERSLLDRAMETAESFLSSREQFPGAKTPLPLHRAPDMTAPLRRVRR